MLTKMMKSRLKTALTSFVEDTRAGISVEAVFMFPIIAWAYVGSFAWFDAFRAQNTNLKASYSISDILSRETDPITQNYFNGIEQLYNFLVFDRAGDTWIRVTVVRWSEDNGEYVVEWSRASTGRDVWTTESLVAVEDQIPALANGATGILFEANTTYHAMFNAGFTEMKFENFIFTSPRFAPRLCWETCIDGAGG